MNVLTMKTSIKKELWEFKNILTWVPVALAVLIFVIPALNLLLNDIDTHALFIRLERLVDFQYSHSPEIEKIIFVGLISIFAPFLVLSTIVQLYYFLTCFYDERRDQSVMFWRSLPVSDELTIMSKLITGALVIPAIFFMVATLVLISILIIALVACIVLSVGYDISLWGVWISSSIISSFSIIWVTLLPLAIWLLPLFAWLMLASMYAKKAPFLWAVLPVAAVMIVEGIAVHYLSLPRPFIGSYLLEYFALAPNNVEPFNVVDGINRLTPIQSIAAKIDFSTAFMSGILFYAIYWLRVNKSEA
jgi:ABC-2 type transport system permease protein